MVESISVETKTMHKCPECYEAYDRYNRATRCVYEHAREQALNADFESGYYTLEQLWRTYNIGTELSDKMKNITIDNCFVVSHLQCCDKPAYRIKHIDGYGQITVGGMGSWSGYYSSKVGYHSLQDPRPKEELFVDKRS